jgi:DNA-binding transcriptional LysR family regulator
MTWQRFVTTPSISPSVHTATSDICSEVLLDETLVAVVRAGHPTIAANTRPTLKRFAALQHIVVSRKGHRRNDVDEALDRAGFERLTRTVLPSFSAALAMVMQSDATTVAPRRLTSPWLQVGALNCFTCPVPLPAVSVSQHWHASNTADQPHQWLRSCIRRAADHVENEVPRASR